MPDINGKFFDFLLSPLRFRLLDLNKGEGAGKFGKEAA
jgi:hypothetical protein